MIIEKIINNCNHNPEKPAILWENSMISYKVLKAKMNECIKLLNEYKIDKGDIIGLVFENRPDFIYWLLALFSIGCPVALIPTYFKESEIRYHLQAIGLKTCIVQNKYNQFYSNYIQRYSNDFYSIVEVNDKGTNNFIFKTDDRIVQFTSGSQGESKAVVRSENSLLNEIEALLEPFSPIDEKSLFAPLTPIFHSYGLIGGTLLPLFIGKSIFLADVRYPKSVLEKIMEHKVTHIFATPVLYDSYCTIISNSSKSSSKSFDFSTVIKCFSAGGVMKQESGQEFKKLTGLNIFQNYGSTETGTMAIGEIPIYLNNSLGKFISNAEVHCQKLDVIEDVTAEELLIKNNIIDFYYLYPEKLNKEKFYFDFYRTGDLVTNENGYMQYIGRSDGMVNVNGLKVYLNEIENVLKKMNDIKEVAVVNHEQYGEQYICAYVVLKNNCSVTENEVKNYCRQNIADYKIPKKVVFLDMLPQNNSGKILKKYLKEEI